MPSDRFIATINGYTMKVSTVDDGFEASIVQHLYMNRPGAKLENLGLNARSITVNSYWNRENYEDHKGFLNGLYKGDLSEFIHPNYGTIIGHVQSAHVHHDDGINYCEIQITFIEDSSQLSVPSASADISASTEELFQQATQEQIVLAGTSLLGAVHSIQAAVENGIAAFEGVMQNVALPADALVSAIDYGTSLPGRLVGSVANCVARYATAYKTLVQSPVAFFNSIDLGYRKLMQSIDSFSISSGSPSVDGTAKTILAQHLGLAAAQQHCLQAAYVFESEETGRNTIRKWEKATAFDSQGNYVPQEPMPQIMNAREIDHVLYLIRKFCQERIGVYGSNDPTATREVPSLKAMCSAILAYVETVKLEMEAIVTIDVDPPMPLHMVCLREGLPYAMAERILSINSIGNSNAVSGKINIYVS
jgi:hypothetical protein